MTSPENSIKDAPVWFRLLLYGIKEVGLLTCLVIFICYQSFSQLPSVQQSFQQQTDKIVEAVQNNNKVMIELTHQMQRNAETIEDLAGKIK